MKSQIISVFSFNKIEFSYYAGRKKIPHLYSKCGFHYSKSEISENIYYSFIPEAVRLSTNRFCAKRYRISRGISVKSTPVETTAFV